MTTYLLNVSVCVKLNSLVDREVKFCYFTQVLKQGINVNTMCPNYNNPRT